MEITIPQEAWDSFIVMLHFSSLHLLHFNSTMSIVMLTDNVIHPSMHWSFLLPACSPTSLTIKFWKWKWINDFCDILWFFPPSFLPLLICFPGILALNVNWISKIPAFKSAYLCVPKSPSLLAVLALHRSPLPLRTTFWYISFPINSTCSNGHGD